MKETGNLILSDVLRTEGVNAQGFGTIPKTLTRDPRLPIGAKGLYAYFCSFAGAGNTAFPCRDTILKDLKINKETYYKHLNLLKELDYIRCEQKNERACFRHNVFTIVACPDPVNCSTDPCTEKPDTAQGRGFLPCTEKPDTGSPCAEKPDTACTEKPDTNNNRDNINKNKNQSIYHISKIEKMEKYKRVIKENIDYDTLVNGQQEDLAKSIFEVIIETLCSEAEHFKIKGVLVEAPIVKRRMLMLNYFDIAYILNTLGGTTEPIRNPKRYLRSVLYNAPASSPLYWTYEINNVQQEYHERQREKERQEQLARSLEELQDL